MFQTLADITSAGTVAGLKKTGRHTDQPVRRHSRAAGREGVFWRGIERQEARRIVTAARRYELVTRQPGARKGALGFVAL